nr:solute carrier family 12 member 3-like [Macaca nemestrina]XP_024642658.1 solute carrier family 12 member 3-like [Macaca nemestrina]
MTYKTCDAFDYNYGIGLIRMPGGLSLATQHQAQDSILTPAASMFQSKQGRRAVDVYWLGDDEGKDSMAPQEVPSSPSSRENRKGKIVTYKPERIRK